MASEHLETRAQSECAGSLNPGSWKATVRLGKLVLVLGAKFQMRPSWPLASRCMVVSEPPRHMGPPNSAGQWGGEGGFVAGGWREDFEDLHSMKGTMTCKTSRRTEILGRDCYSPGKAPGVSVFHPILISTLLLDVPLLPQTQYMPDKDIVLLSRWMSTPGPALPVCPDSAASGPQLPPAHPVLHPVWSPG